MDDNIVVSVVIAVVGYAVMWGDMRARVKSLEKKMDKHNSFIERLTRCEDKLKAKENEK